MSVEPRTSTPYIHDEGYEEPPFSDLSEKIEEMSRQRKNRLPRKILDAIVQGISWPSKKILDWADEERVKHLTEEPEFKKFENMLAQYAPNPANYPSVFDYLDALMIADQLNAALDAIGHRLPDKIKALDVGCGRNWLYSGILYSFLQNYRTGKPREVELDGIDLLASERNIRAFDLKVKDKNIMFERGDVLNLDRKNIYDFIFMHKMLTSPMHFRNWKLESRDVEQIIKKCSEMLTPGGIHFVSNYEQSGEYVEVVETIPPERRIAEFGYKVDVGNGILNDRLTPGIDREYRSGICICRK